MIFGKLFRRLFNRKLTVSSAEGWNVGASLFGGTELQAMRLPAVNACIEILSDSVAKLPIFLMDGETREQIRRHPAIRLLTVRPTECLTAFDYHKLMESRRIAYGNAYALIFRNPYGEPTELLPIEPGYMQPILDDNGKLWYVGTNPRTGEYRKFWSTDVLHYKAFMTDSLEGIGYLRRGRELLETAMQAQKYETNFFKNNGAPGGVLEVETDLSSKSFIDENGNEIDAKEIIRKSWEKVHSGADNAFRVAVLDMGMKYKPISSSNRDAQFIETKTASIEDIGRLFNIPLYKLGVGKQTYQSNEQAAIEYMQRTLSPIIAEREQEDTYKLLTAAEQQKGLQIRRNMMGELRGDWNARAAYYRTLSDIGAYSPNDIRALEDMPAVEGGDSCKASLNYVPLKDWGEISKNRNAKTGGDKE